ncbi:hypothetical protein GCM10029992_49490 [Glycomyces albus]
MALKKAKAGLRLRRFREEQGLTQSALAAALGISTSYVNQIESNQRPLTGPVLLRLAEVFAVDVQRFAASESDRLTAQLRDALADTAHADRAWAAEARELAESMPELAQYVVDLHRRYRHALERNAAMSAELDAGAAPTAHEEVRDLFYAKRNHVAELDEAAERIYEGPGSNRATSPGASRGSCASGTALRSPTSKRARGSAASAGTTPRPES